MTVRGILAGVAAVTALAACSSSKPPEPPSSPAPPPSGALLSPAPLPDVCARVPAAEVVRAANLSGSVQAQAKATSRDAGCSYTESGRTVVWVDYRPEQRSAFDASRKMLGSGRSCVDVPGLGDAAYRCTNPVGGLTLRAFADGHAIAVSIDNAPGEDAVAVKAIATLVLARL